MDSRLIVGRMSDDPLIGGRIAVIDESARYAVERDTLHDTTVFYLNVNYRNGLSARWRALAPGNPEDAAAFARIAATLAWKLERERAQGQRLQAVS